MSCYGSLGQVSVTGNRGHGWDLALGQHLLRISVVRQNGTPAPAGGRTGWLRSASNKETAHFRTVELKVKPCLHNRVSLSEKGTKVQIESKWVMTA